MNETNEQSILHDAYFNKKPALALLFGVRLALLCALSVSAIMVLLSVYRFGIDPHVPALTALFSSAVFFTLASVIPSRFVYGGTIALGGVLSFLFFDKLKMWGELFYDKLMLLLDSRLFDTDNLVIRNLNNLKGGVYDGKLNEASLVVFIILAVVLSFIFTASLRTKIHIGFPIAIMMLLLVPSFISEFARFTPWLIVFVSSAMGLGAVYSGYFLDRSFIFDNKLEAARSYMAGEGAYKKRTSFYFGSKKLSGDLKRYYKFTANAITVVILSAAVMTGVSLAVPEGQGFDYDGIVNTITEFASSASEKLQNIFRQDTVTDSESEYFSNIVSGEPDSGIRITAPSTGDTPVLSVILERNDIPVYLRGDIGVDFNGTGWTAVKDAYNTAKSADGTRYYDKLKDFYPETEYQNFRKIISGEYIPDTYMPLQTVKVTYLRNSRVIFQPVAPFELNYKESSHIEAIGDTVYRTKAENGFIKTYESLCLTPNITDSFIVNSAAEKSIPSESRYDIENYREYISAVFMKSDDRIKEFVDTLRKEIAVVNGTSLYVNRYAIASEICSYFKDNFSYSLTVDNGEDPLSGFLYETREGHCALFATAMTLALRELGIPARYVTGYVVNGAYAPVESGFEYTIREKNLHAWVEVYFRNVGWLPFDPTASVRGFEDGAIADISDEGEEEPEGGEDIETIPETNPSEGIPGKEETEEEREEPSEEVTEEEEETETNEENTSYPTYPEESADPSEPSFNFLVLVPYLIGAAVVMAVVLFVILVIRNVNAAEKRVFRAFRKKPSAEACAIMYRLLLKLLKSAGLEPENELMMDFAERVDRSDILKGKNVFLTDVMPVFEKCEFGDKNTLNVTEEERAAVFRVLRAVYTEIMGRYNFIRQFFVKIALFF